MRYVDDEENDWVNIDVTSRNAIVLKGKALFSATSFKSFRGPNRMVQNLDLQNRATVSQIGLVDSRVLGSPKSLAELYSASVEAGNLGNVLNLAKEIVPGVRDIRLLMEGEMPSFTWSWRIPAFPLEFWAMACRCSFDLPSRWQWFRLVSCCWRSRRFINIRG
jgi:hypothetical protein